MTGCGIDLGGTNIKAVTVTSDGETLYQTSCGFDANEKMVWADKIQGLVQQLQNQIGKIAVAVGVSAPGLASADRRSIFHMPGRLQGLEGLDWTDFLGAAHPVPVLNDAHAAL